MNSARRAVCILAVLGTFGAATVFAAPIPCPQSPLSAYLTAGFTCMENVFTVKSFFFQGPAVGQGGGGVTASSIIVNPIQAADRIGFAFTGAFNLDQGTAVYQLNYFIDPPPPIIRAEQIDVDPAMLNTILCATNTFPCPDPSILANLTATSSASVVLPAPVNMMAVQNKLTLDATNGPVRSLGFDNMTFIIATPEPGAMVLTASGLLGLFAFRSRAKLRQILFQFRS